MDEIPDELLLHIVDQLRGPTTWSDPADYSRMHALAALCCVSRKLYHIARPLLYESIDLPPNEGIYSKSQRLLTHLQEQPRFRLDIKALRQKTRPDLKREYRLPISARDEYRKYIMTILGAVGLDIVDASTLVERWIRHEDLFFALVAFQTPKLERLWVRLPTRTHGYDDGCTLLEGIGRMTMGVRWLDIHHFENLKTLYLDFISAPETSPQDSLPLLLLPNLNELTLGSWGGKSSLAADVEQPAFNYQDNDSFVFGRFWVWPVRSSPITKLSLFKPFVSENMVKKMILACKALKQFECIHPIFSRYGDEWFGGLVPALNNHLESLEDLSLLCRMYGPSLEDTGMARLEPLRRLVNLKSARISLYLVSDEGNRLNPQFVPDFFPPSLESLRIHYPRKPDVEADAKLLEILTGVKEGCLPSLRDVYITWVYFQPQKEQYDLLERLRSLLEIKKQYETSGIQFDILFTIKDDKRFNLEWAKLANLEGMTMNGTYLSDEHDIDQETCVFVDFTTCPGRYTVEEQQDDRDHGYFW